MFPAYVARKVTAEQKCTHIHTDTFKVGVGGLGVFCTAACIFNYLCVHLQILNFRQNQPSPVALALMETSDINKLFQPVRLDSY